MASEAAPKTFRGVTQIVRETPVSRTLMVEVSRYCLTCRRRLTEPGAAEQHARRGHLVEVVTTTTAVMGTVAAVDRLILAQTGVMAHA